MNNFHIALAVIVVELITSIVGIYCLIRFPFKGKGGHFITLVYLPFYGMYLLFIRPKVNKGNRLGASTDNSTPNH